MYKCHLHSFSFIYSVLIVFCSQRPVQKLKQQSGSSNKVAHLKKKACANPRHTDKNARLTQKHTACSAGHWCRRRNLPLLPLLLRARKHVTSGSRSAWSVAIPVSVRLAPARALVELFERVRWAGLLHSRSTFGPVSSSSGRRVCALVGRGRFCVALFAVRHPQIPSCTEPPCFRTNPALRNRHSAPNRRTT